MAWFQDGQGDNQEVNDPETQCNLGDKYYNGDRVTQDYNEAIKWYRLAAEQGYAKAQNNLGIMYDSGLGVKQDYSEAIKWYRLAADKGYSGAQTSLGIMYDYGRGVKKDHLEALKWYRKAADQGDADAQFFIGNMYHWGEVKPITKDYAEAIKWFQKGAVQGDDEAQYWVGFYYLYGLYYPPDIKEALKWLRKSAEQNNIEAKRYLDHILKVQTELEGIRNKIEPRFFRVAELLLQIPRIPTGIWEGLEKGQRPSKKEANKFFLACILDYQMKAELVWSNTRKFVEEKIDDPEDLWGLVLSYSLEEWKQKKKEYKLHRFEIGHMRVWKIGRDLMKSYRGDARSIWEDQEPGEVIQRLYHLGEGEYGVGENIANMIVGALIDTEQIKGVGDVKADTHVRKILGRVFRGYNFGTDEARECTEFARKIYPPNPWLLDQPLYFLGKTTCKEKTPDCPNCYLRQECMYLKKQSLT